MWQVSTVYLPREKLSGLSKNGEKKARLKRKERRSIRMRIGLAEPKKPPTPSNQPKQSKQSKQLEQYKQAKQSKQEMTARSKAANTEQPESVVTSDATASKPLPSFLRPCNIIGGGFACTPTGCVPQFAHGY